MKDLFETQPSQIPLATRMRPQSLDQVVGQQHLLAAQKPLHQVVATQKCHSMILWGPPGTGKTTLAEIIVSSLGAHIEKISAVLAGVKDIRQVVATARERRAHNQMTVLFVDEVHRFNKAQQDAFLPHVEAGEVILIGATTENPSFALNNALLSRVRVYVLKSLTADDLLQLLVRAAKEVDLIASELLLKRMAIAADGDARVALNLLEVAKDFSDAETKQLTDEIVSEVLSTSLRRFDHQGDIFYDQISALHKSVRGSDPDAALYWFSRMIDGGCDPHYIARRVLRMASEDIGNADPRALNLALDAWQTFERLGSPEGELAIAQAIVYCAIAAKSNAVYTALHAAQAAVKNHGTLEVPLELRNAPTKLLKALGHGENYRYAHDEPEAFAKGVCYLPEELQDELYYQPVERGMEIKIKQKLDHFRQLNREAKDLA